MRISRGLGIALVAGSALIAVPAFAGDAACVDGQCAVLVDNVLTSDEAPHFVAEVPLPPVRSQSPIVLRQKATPRIVLASARSFPVTVPGVIPPQREAPKLTSFWLTIGTGF